MPSLINMELSAEEVREETNPSPAAAPKYPWGLALTLNDDTLEKLGVTTLPEVNSEVRIVAKAEVASVRTWQTLGGEDERSVELQITDMQVEGVGSELFARVPQLLYGKQK